MPSLSARMECVRLQRNYVCDHLLDMLPCCNDCCCPVIIVRSIPTAITILHFSSPLHEDESVQGSGDILNPLAHGTFEILVQYCASPCGKARRPVGLYEVGTTRLIMRGQSSMLRDSCPCLSLGNACCFPRFNCCEVSRVNKDCLSSIRPLSRITSGRSSHLLQQARPILSPNIR